MKVIIIGGRGTATVVAEQIEEAHTRHGMNIEVLGLALDDLSNGDSVSGFPILCPINQVHQKYGQYDDVHYIYQLYRSDAICERTGILNALNIPIQKFCNFIHPTVTISKSVKMGYGNILLANSVFNINASMGNFNTFTGGNLFGHDSRIGNNNFFAGQSCLGSFTEIGNMNFIGLNTTLLGNLKIGDGNIIGQASNVIKNVDNYKTLVGNPAKIVKNRAVEI